MAYGITKRPQVADIAAVDGRGVTAAKGFSAAAVRCGLKSEGDDLAAILCSGGASAAGVFTSNQVRASCVERNARLVPAADVRAVVVNAGNANCCNGPRGDLDNESMAAALACALALAPDQVLTASTGVIGRPLLLEQVRAGIAAIPARLASGAEADLSAARAVMTTDSRPKMAAVEVRGAHGAYRIGGMCKGAGMIAPRMVRPSSLHATMLCFLTTDARVSPESLQEALESAVAHTLNRVTVDGDTSTNDMALILASGASGVGGDSAPDGFAEGLEAVCRSLARQVARDGEGATRLVEVLVRGAQTEEDADRVARTVAESPLVKTAIHGSDPNWGRLMMAAGRAGVRFDPSRVTAAIGETVVFQLGSGVAFNESAVSAYLGQPEVRITLDLGAGESEALFYTCDYSHGYITINADYHT